jgi:hypothetical protein
MHEERMVILTLLTEVVVTEGLNCWSPAWELLEHCQMIDRDPRLETPACLERMVDWE